MQRTKHRDPSTLMKENDNPLVRLFLEFAQLKNLYRQGWITKGRDVSRTDCETVAEHSFSVALLSYVIAKEYFPHIYAERAMLLGLVHDLGEIHAGDITPHEIISPKEKFQREYESVQKTFANFPNAKHYIGLWLEYAEGKTHESRLVQQVDKLEMALEGALYRSMGYKRLDEIINDAKSTLTIPQLQEILNSF